MIRMKPLTALAAVAAIVLAGPSASAQNTAAAKFGAFAYSAKARDMGAAYDWTSRAAAEKAAMKNCADHSDKAKDCAVVLWFSNSCGAFALTPEGIFGTGYGPGKYIAEGYALQYCHDNGGGEQCAIKQSSCTGV